MVYIQNKYFSITHSDEKLFIKTTSKGFSIQEFQAIMKKYPRITISYFLALKKALEEPTNEAIEFGTLKPKFELYVTPDNLECKIYINLNEEEFETEKVEVTSQIIKLLEEKKITYGLLYDVINKGLGVQKHIVIAKGNLPQKGEDASTSNLELSQNKPKINEDGSADFYEMNLFQYVKKGDWLGEKTLPGKGEPGMNIKGEILPSQLGKDKNLRFDPKTVETTDETNRVVMRAKVDGALQIQEGKTSVAEHLIIHGDIGYGTGNIDFQGYITVEGTVEDGFSVTADKDISIQGDMGVGAVEKIFSKRGNVYIKGGISGKGKAVVEAGQSVFVKYVNDCTVKAGDSINIGFYALNSKLEAENISVEAKNGKTIGGSIQAKFKVSLRNVGNIYEKETTIQVDGFDRKALKQELDDLLEKYKVLLQEAEKTRRELETYENMLVNTDNIKDTKDYIFYHKIHQDIMDQVYALEEKRKELVRKLASKGEGEVSIHEKAYPQTFLQIKNIQKRINTVTSGSFYTIGNKLMYDQRGEAVGGSK